MGVQCFEHAILCIFRDVTPTIPARGMSVQMAAKAAQLNAIALPLKWGGNGVLNLIISNKEVTYRHKVSYA